MHAKLLARAIMIVSACGEDTSHELAASIDDVFFQLDEKDLSAEPEHGVAPSTCMVRLDMNRTLIAMARQGEFGQLGDQFCSWDEYAAIVLIHEERCHNIDRHFSRFDHVNVRSVEEKDLFEASQQCARTSVSTVSALCGNEECSDEELVCFVYDQEGYNVINSGFSSEEPLMNAFTVSSLAAEHGIPIKEFIQTNDYAMVRFLNAPNPFSNSWSRAFLDLLDDSNLSPQAIDCPN